MPSASVPDFLPSRHGLPFHNYFPGDSPVMTIPTPFGAIPIGNASGGLCGGMIFTVMDLFARQQPPPPSATSDVFAYLSRRLIDSFNLPFGFLKYYDWQRRPLASRSLAGIVVQEGLTYLSVVREWPKIRALLDAQQLAPLGLVKAHSFNPMELGQNHQVLAYAYDLNEESGDVMIRVYDPNFKNDDDVSLFMNLNNPLDGCPIFHYFEGEVVRGIFLTDYSPPVQPPEFRSLEEL